MPNKKDHPFKNTRMPLSQRVVFSFIRFTFKILGVISPKLAGRLALRLFMTPTKFGTPRKEKALRESAVLKSINVRGRKISVRTWGKADAPAVLLSHGWGGRATQFHAFITPLVDAGYKVIGFDLPAHGDSEGSYTNMMDAALVISEVAKQEGEQKGEKEAEFEAIIGHSFGTGTALLAMDKYDVRAKKLVLIAYFSDVIWITNLFGEMFDLSDSTLDAMRQIALVKFKDTFDISWNWADISPTHTIKSIQAELLLIHDEKDHEVPYSQAKPLQTLVPQAQIMTTSGYGHRKILMHKKVVERVLAFIHG